MQPQPPNQYLFKLFIKIWKFALRSPRVPPLLHLHSCLCVVGSLCEAMRKRRETPVVQDIGDIMLARVGELALMA